MPTNTKIGANAFPSTTTVLRHRPPHASPHQHAQPPLAPPPPPAPPPDQFLASTQELHWIHSSQVAVRLTPGLEAEINKVAQTCWHDFDLRDDLEVLSSAPRFDYLFYLKEGDAIVGFRSARWEPRVQAYVFENGVVRDRANGLGSHLAQLIVRFFLTSPRVPDNRRRVFADVERNNVANFRL